MRKGEIKVYHEDVEVEYTKSYFDSYGKREWVKDTEPIVIIPDSKINKKRAKTKNVVFTKLLAQQKQNKISDLQVEETDQYIKFNYVVVR